MSFFRMNNPALTGAFALSLALTLIGPVMASGRRQEPAGGSGGQPVEGGEIRFGLTTEPTTLDPLHASNTADGRSILFNVFEGLVKPDTEGGLEMAVAQSYTVEQGGLVYVFTLRPGLKFHDGTEVTAEDVKFSLDTAIQTGFAGFDQIDRVEITTDRKIRVTLKLPRRGIPHLPHRGHRPPEQPEPGAERHRHRALRH